MELRDVIHGSIEISKAEAMIVNAPFFQRLRNIKQLGFGENSYPGATHNRFIHSVGAMHLAGIAFDSAFMVEKGPSLASRFPEAYLRLRSALRAAALLHDVGHGPLSHTTEFAMPALHELGLGLTTKLVDGTFTTEPENRQANHEDYTLKIILQSSLTPTLKRALGYLGIEPFHIARILKPELMPADDFFTVGGVDYLPIMHQLVSSEIDVDRMDYLPRDSFYAGVSYGKFDLAWLLTNLTHHVRNGSCYLAIGHKALYTFDDFLISRFHMFLMVYFHHKCVIFDEMLGRYLQAPDCDYSIPADVEKYIFYDDYHLYTHLSRSENDWARRIYHKNPYRMMVEFHSGIPQGEIFKKEQEDQLREIIRQLEASKTDYIVKTTTGELSKYSRHDDELPIYVKYDPHWGEARYIPIHECTDLFERYSRERSITRIYKA